MWGDEKTELDRRTEEKKNAWIVLGSQTSSSRHPPSPQSSCQSLGRPTSDLLSLSGVLIGSPAAHVDCSFTVRLSLRHTHTHTHTHTHNNNNNNKHTLLPVCVWFCDRSSEDFFGTLCFLFFCLFSFSFCSSLYCMDDPSYCDKKVFQKKILRKNHHNLTFLLVFQMQKECFSLPAIKATMTLFLYTNGAKKKYIYI